MEKLDFALLVLGIIFIFVLGFVVSDFYFKDKTNASIQVNNAQNNPDKPMKNNNVSISLGSDVDSCINNTKDNPQCKDCCDCLAGVDSETRTACRDSCAVHDFSKNYDIISIDVPSILGKDGNYSVCVAKGSLECKTCCENQIVLQCGDYQYCRTACNNAFGDAKHNISATTT